MSPMPAAHVPWHYSGSFRWTRNKDLYSRNWRAIDASWYGPETYPGRHFSVAESACLYGEFAYGGVGLYLVDQWNQWAGDAAAQWKRDNAADLARPQLCSIVLTAHAQPVRVHESIRSVQAQSADNWQLLVVSSGRIPAAELMTPYHADARIQLFETGEHVSIDGRGQGQASAINLAWRHGRIRGDLVLYLSDDDTLHPTIVADWSAIAAANSDQHAWYGRANRCRVHPGGFVEDLGPLGLVGDGDVGRSLRTHVDGMQVCHRRSARVDWPEDPGKAGQADGFWMEALAGSARIHAAPVLVGTHRHTPESTFTR